MLCIANNVSAHALVGHREGSILVCGAQLTYGCQVCMMLTSTIHMPMGGSITYPAR